MKTPPPITPLEFQKPTALSPPDQELIATRRRLRLTCQWFADFSAGLSEAGDGISAATRAQIDAQGFTRADLTAIRSTPHKWHLGNAYAWLWLLHRYMNRAA